MKILRGGLNIIASLLLLGQIVLPGVALGETSGSTTPTPSSTATPTPSSTATPIPSSTATPTPSVIATPTPSVTATSTPSDSATATPASLLASGSVDPTATPSGTATPTPSGSATIATRGATPACHGNPPDYVFDNDLHKWVAADMDSFACDTASGYFLSPKYYIDVRTGWYRTMPASGVAPTGTLTAPQIIHTILGDVVVGSPDYRAAVALGIITPTGQAVTASNTGPNSTNQGTIGNSNQAWFDMTSLVNVINVLQSTAGSGNVSAQSNTKAGNISSGTVNVMANLINLLASAWSWSHGNLSFFMQNLFGNQTGDITLRPTATSTSGGGGLGTQSIANGQTGSGSTNAGTINNTNGLNVNASFTGSITNNVNLAAQSGNAIAADNTRIGNVGTGNATAQANIINLINSFINSGSSFFGILNIFGNLNGDILFPAGFLNGLLGSGPLPAGSASVAANGTGSGSTNQGTINNTQQTNLTGTSSQNFNNNLNTTANSGSANLSGNTTSGSVSTGAATTSGSLFNLANSSIFGDNAVLVMVNVLGHWMGRIMSLPGGTSQAALLTGNASVTQNNTGSGSTNQGTINNTGTANINQASVGTITNNVNVAAQSGNATATDNTKVGDVATGTAKATSAIANIMNTALNVKHWFGVLIINVFGEWTGSVNENTSAGDAPHAAASTTASQPQIAATLPTAARIFSEPFIRAAKTPDTIVPQETTSAASQAAGQVLTAAAQAPANIATLAQHNKDMTWLFAISALLLLFAGAVSQVERKLRKN